MATHSYTFHPLLIFINFRDECDSFFPSWNAQPCPEDRRLHQCAAKSVFHSPWHAAGASQHCPVARSSFIARPRELRSDQGARAENGTKSLKMGFKLCSLAWPLTQLGFWQRVPRVALHGDPSCLWFTNCFTNISSLWEVWYTLHPPQLTRVTRPLSQTCLCLQFFRKFSQREKNPPSSSSVLFLSQHFPQVYLC